MVLLLQLAMGQPVDQNASKQCVGTPPSVWEAQRPVRSMPSFFSAVRLLSLSHK